MKILLSFLLFWTVLWGTNVLSADPVKDLSKLFGMVSVYYSVPDNDNQNFADVVFRFGWNKKAPYKIAIQLVNHGYGDRKIRFAIKDVTSKKMVLLDAARKSRFGSETLKANSKGRIWSGPIDDPKDSFSLHVWTSDGDEFDKEPISFNDQQ